jgi:hypothetical protein
LPARIRRPVLENAIGAAASLGGPFINLAGVKAIERALWEVRRQPVRTMTANINAARINQATISRAARTGDIMFTQAEVGYRHLRFAQGANHEIGYSRSGNPPA